MPEPLLDSPKRPRCSLHGICLPDETNWLLKRSKEPPAHVMPGLDERGVLYVSEPGTYVVRRCLALTRGQTLPGTYVWANARIVWRSRRRTMRRFTRLR